MVILNVKIIKWQNETYLRALYNGLYQHTNDRIGNKIKYNRAIPNNVGVPSKPLTTPAKALKTFMSNVITYT